MSIDQAVFQLVICLSRDAQLLGGRPSQQLALWPRHVDMGADVARFLKAMIS